MSSDNGPNLPTPKSVLDQLKEWQELIAYLAAGLASGLGIFLSSGAAQIVSAVVAIVVVAGGSWQVRRSHRRKKQREEQERLWEERRKQPRAAFRSLSPFEEQDELPGQDRKQQARSIAVRIVNDDFRFGIVCGDSGAGKTSLLRSEVMRYIRANGLESVYLRSPRRLARTGFENASACERLTAELDAFEQESIPAAACVLILDQFEEWFVEYREPEARALLGRFIAKLTRRVPPVRVVCAVRREFLMDFHDLAAELPDPTQPNNTFRVRNFTVAQAVDAVQQCAAADGLAAEDSFAARLAADLEDNGEVRPPELQIICTHLAESGSLSSDRYQAEGGTAGILAHHIKNALESCREPETGAKLLRSLCDFSTRTKRPPKTLAALAADIGRTAESATVAGLVRTFVLARLLVEEKRKGSPDAYGLLHDYLVGAVELATGDVSTRTEEANQLLRYYLAQQAGVIPLRRLRFIRAHADRPLLAQPNARRLFRKSLIAPALLSVAMVCAAVLMAGGLYLMATAGVQWQEKVIGRHWEENESGYIEYITLPRNNQVVSVPSFSEIYKYIKLVSAKKGQVEKKVFIGDISSSMQRRFSFSKNGESILIESNVNSSNNDIDKSFLINIDRKIELPHGNRYCFSGSEKEIIFQIDNSKLFNNVKTFDVAMYSIDKNKIIRKVNNIALYKKEPILKYCYSIFNNEGDRLITVSQEGDKNVIFLYDSMYGIILKKSTKQGDSAVDFAFNEKTGKICTISSNAVGEISANLWSVHDGSLLQAKKIAKEEFYISKIVNFYDGSIFIRRGSGVSYSGVDTFKSPDLIQSYINNPIENINIKHIHLAANHYRDYNQPPVIYWQDRIGLSLWQIGQEPSVILGGIKLGDKDKVSSDSDMQRSVIWGPHRPAELWDLKEKKRICQLTSQKDKHIQSISFSMNDTAVVVQEEGNIASLFATKDGAPLAQHISAASVYYYDPELRRIHAWNSSGQVLRYVEGRSYFGKFVPTKKGARD